MKSCRDPSLLWKSVLLLAAVTFLYAPPPDTAWCRCYGGDGDDWAYLGEQTADGGFIVAGRYYTVGSMGDAYIIKTDAKGDTIWTKTYGGYNEDRVFHVIPTFDGGYMAAGYKTVYHEEAWLLKLYENGDTMWTKSFGGVIADDEFDFVCQTADSGYIACGGTHSYGAGDYDVWLVKTDKNGEMEWHRTYGGPDLDYGYDIVQKPDSGYLFIAWTESFGAGGIDIWFVRTDANGNVVWDETYGHAGDEWAYSFRETPDSGYIIAGRTNSIGAGGYDFWVIRTDSLGNVEWDTTHGGPYEDCCSSIDLTWDGEYILIGWTYSFGEGADDFWLMKCNTDGCCVWSQTYGGSSTDFPYCVRATADGGYFMCGGTGSFGNGLEAWLIKTEPDEGITERTSDATAGKLSVYPNPFSEAVSITFGVDSRQYGVGSIQIYDITGRLVKSFGSLPHAPSLMHITWDGCDNNRKALPSGVYILRVKAGEHSETQKLLLIR